MFEISIHLITLPIQIFHVKYSNQPFVLFYPLFVYCYPHADENTNSECWQHTPRVIGEIPDVNDATLDHERLSERLHTLA